MLLTSEAHKRSEQTRSSSYLHANSPDTCTVKNACEFTTCYPESYLAHAHAVDTRPSILREGLGTRLDMHLPHVYVDRVIQGHNYEKRIEVREIFQQQ